MDEVILGCSKQAGENNRNAARMCLLLAGLPETVPGTTINRLYGSGMDAVLMAARAIRVGEADLVIAGAVESMSRALLVMPKAEAAFSRRARTHDTTIGWRFVNPAMKAQYGVEAFGISRGDQDETAFRAQQKANAALAKGRSARGIVPMTLAQAKGGARFISTDEHLRPDTTPEMLAALATPFSKGGTVTAGYSSGINDGSADLILAAAGALDRHELTPMVPGRGGAAVGVAPRNMGMGRMPASQKLIARLGLTAANFDVSELNEAFAAQGLASLPALGIGVGQGLAISLERA